MTARSPKRIALFLIAGAVALAGCYEAYRYFFRKVTYASGGDLPEMIREVFAASELELYSLDPSKGDKDGKGFRGWTVLGKVALEGAAAKSAREAFERGVKESDGRGAKCFIPRHGLRAASVDLVICFECFHVYAYKGWDKAFCNTTATPAPVLNKILSDAGIPLPPPPPK
jgi:hypothetical protein